MLSDQSRKIVAVLPQSEQNEIFLLWQGIISKKQYIPVDSVAEAVMGFAKFTVNTFIEPVKCMVEIDSLYHIPYCILGKKWSGHIDDVDAVISDTIMVSNFHNEQKFEKWD